MKKSVRYTLLSLLVVGAYVLSACGGAVPQSTTTGVAQKVQALEIAFTGIVEAMDGNQWTVSGKLVTVDPSAAMDPNIAVGDIVKVEGNISADGVVVALTIESSTADDNSNDANSNDGNTNANANGNSNDDNANGAANTNDANSNGDNSNAAGGGSEVFGAVESISADSISVGGVMYQFASFTEIKDAITVGDQVKIHLIVNADGTFAIREIEKTDGLGLNDNGNSNNSNDDNGNDSNSNDDHGNDGNSNDDHGGRGGSNDNGGGDDHDGGSGNDNGGGGDD